MHARRSWTAELAPLILRVAFGVIVFAHGWSKIYGEEGLHAPEGFIGFLTSMNVPMPEVLGWAVVAVEVGGSIMLILGLLTRLAALLTVVDMASAIYLVKLELGLIAPEGRGAGAEIDLAVLAACLALVLLGPGGISLDRMLGLERG